VSVVLLMPGQTWRTVSLERVPSDALHTSAVVTIQKVWSHGSQRWVKYSYRDYTDIGDFDGRDSDPEDLFRRQFPLLVEERT
jgi:hypothetical protein